MNRIDENFLSWLLMFFGFMLILAWASFSIDFDKKCIESCAPQQAISPVYNFQQTCFCDEGKGKWKMKDVRNL